MVSVWTVWVTSIAMRVEVMSWPTASTTVMCRRASGGTNQS